MSDPMISVKDLAVNFKINSNFIDDNVFDIKECMLPMSRFPLISK